MPNVGLKYSLTWLAQNKVEKVVAEWIRLGILGSDI